MDDPAARGGERFFYVLVALTVAIGIALYAWISIARAVAIRSYSSRLDVQRLLTLTLDQETGVRGFAATGQRLFLQPYVRGVATYDALLARVRSDFVSPLERFRPQVDAYDREHRAWIQGVAQPLASRRAINSVALERDGKRDVDAMRAIAGRLDDELAAAGDRYTMTVQWLIAGSIALIVLMTAILGAMALRAQRRANLALQRSNRRLEEFAYVASHDLQEPLRTVASFTDLLRDNYRDRLDERAQGYLAFIVDGARRMQQLVDDVLAYSRVTTQERRLAPVGLAACCERAVRDVSVMLRERNGRVEIGALPTVLGDEAQLTSLFANLISNGIKYNRSVEPTVVVSAERSGRVMLVHVRDNGIGIDPAYHERIFGLFTRLHGRSEYDGTGIGLAICRSIVERHGGRIVVGPAVGGGTTFSFTLKVPEDAA